MLGANFQDPISSSSIEQLYKNLQKISVKDRIRKYQLKPDRADVIVPALEIYLYILKELECTEVMVPKIGLSDGMVFSMHQKHENT